ncbi:MAG: hypothetical protein KJZ78_16260, partial [Bryobacteraceae bacterium]|nr:hypothetical protein [Bryobacteraceae bacterium]
MRKGISLSLTTVLLAGAMFAQTAASSAALSGSAGTVLAQERLARIDQLLQRYTDEKRIAGAVALVLR